MTQNRHTKKSLKRRLFFPRLWPTYLAGCMVIGVTLAAPATLLGQNPETEYALAAGFYARQQWDLSADAFKMFIADHPDTPQASAASFFLGEAYVQQNDFQSAHPAYQHYLNQHPDGEFASRASFRVGECAYRTGNTKAALRALETFVADHPQHELIQYALPYLGELRLTRSEPQLAQAAFETALKHFPGSTLSNQSRLGLAKSLQAQGAIEDAQRLFTFVASVSESEFTGPANLQLGIIKFKQSDFAAAKVHLRQSITLSPDASGAEAKYWLSRTEMATGNHAAAVKLIDGMSDVELPDELGCIMLFDGAVAATKIDDSQTAIRWLAQLRSKYPQHHLADEASLLEMNLVQSTGDNTRLIGLAQSFTAAFADSSLRSQVAEIAGQAYYQTSDFENTIVTYQQLLADTADRVNADSEDDSNGVSNGDWDGLPTGLEARQKRSKWLYLKSLGHLGLHQYGDAIKELQLAQAYNDVAQVQALSRDPSQDLSDDPSQAPSQIQRGELATLIDLGLATAYFGDRQFSQAAPKYQSFLTNHDLSRLSPNTNHNSISGDSASVSVSASVSASASTPSSPAHPSPEFIRSACELTICFNELEQWEDVAQGLEIMKMCGDAELVKQTIQYLAEQAYDGGQKQLAGKFYSYMTQWENDQATQSRGLSGLAWVYMESTEPAATPFFARLISQYPDSSFSSKATMARAKFLESQNDTDAASDVYSLVSDRFDGSPIANIARLRNANLLHQAGGDQNLAKAQGLLKDYLQSPAEKTAADEALYLLGWVMNDQGESDQAMVRFQRLVTQFPDSKYWSDAAFRIAQQHLRDGQSADAVDLIDQIISSQTAPPEVITRSQYIKGQIAASTQDWADVTPLMEAVIAADVDAKLTWRAKYWLAESQYQQQMYNAASQQFAAISKANVIERSLQPWVQLRLGQCLGKLERWNDAGTVANDALHRYGDFENDFEFIFVRARAAEAQGMLDDAEMLYTEVIESANGRRSETAAIAQWRIGEMHFHKEDYKTAIQAYYKVDSLYDYAKWRSAAILQAGKCQEHLGNWKHAAKLYTQILEKYPDSELAASASQRLRLVNRQADNSTPQKRR